jgi:hypothetical protein
MRKYIAISESIFYQRVISMAFIYLLMLQLNKIQAALRHTRLLKTTVKHYNFDCF